jgi:hypothetical protein
MLVVMASEASTNRVPLVLFGAYVLLFIALGIDPHARAVWWATPRAVWATPTASLPTHSSLALNERVPRLDAE